jgi:hypothetical protein
MKNADAEQVLKQNPQLDPQRIARFESFQARMERAGVDFRTKYTVEAPLGTLASLHQPGR